MHATKLYAQRDLYNYSAVHNVHDLYEFHCIYLSEP